MSGTAAVRKRQGGSAPPRSDALCSEHLNLLAQTHRSSVWEALSRVCNLHLEAVEQQSKRGGLTPAGHTAHCRTWARHTSPELTASAALQLLQGRRPPNFRDPGNSEHLKGRCACANSCTSQRKKIWCAFRISHVTIGAKNFSNRM